MSESHLRCSKERTQTCYAEGNDCESSITALQDKASYGGLKLKLQPERAIDVTTIITYIIIIKIF
jgi:hypothetical protein